MADGHIAARGGSHNTAQCAVCVWGTGTFARTNLQATNAEEGGSKWSMGNILKSAVCAVTVCTDPIFFIFLFKAETEGGLCILHVFDSRRERFTVKATIVCLCVCVIKSDICNHCSYREMLLTVFVLNPVVFTQKQTYEVQLYNGPQ